MMQKPRTITKEDLSDAVYKIGGLSRNEARELTSAIIAEVSDRLIKGEAVKLSGFGTLKVYEKRARIGRNPRTMEDRVISARRVIRFKSSPRLKELVAFNLPEKVSS